MLTRYWEITKNASAWRSEDTRDYAKVSVRFSGLVSDRVYLAATFLLRFCSRASRTYCSIRHLENCDSVIDDVAGVVEISEHDCVFHVEEMPEIAEVTWHHAAPLYLHLLANAGECKMSGSES